MALAVDDDPEFEREPRIAIFVFLFQLGDPVLDFRQFVAVVAVEFNLPAGLAQARHARAREGDPVGFGGQHQDGLIVRERGRPVRPYETAFGQNHGGGALGAGIALDDLDRVALHAAQDGRPVFDRHAVVFERQACIVVPVVASALVVQEAVQQQAGRGRDVLPNLGLQSLRQRQDSVQA
jgi:hypothetical protein